MSDRFYLYLYVAKADQHNESLAEDADDIMNSWDTCSASPYGPGILCLEYEEASSLDELKPLVDARIPFVAYAMSNYSDGPTLIAYNGNAEGVPHQREGDLDIRQMDQGPGRYGCIRLAIGFDVDAQAQIEEHAGSTPGDFIASFRHALDAIRERAGGGS